MKRRGSTEDIWGDSGLIEFELLEYGEFEGGEHVNQFVIVLW